MVKYRPQFAYFQQLQSDVLTIMTSFCFPRYVFASRAQGTETVIKTHQAQQQILLFPFITIVLMGTAVLRREKKSRNAFSHCFSTLKDWKHLKVPSASLVRWYVGQTYMNSFYLMKYSYVEMNMPKQRHIRFYICSVT